MDIIEQIRGATVQHGLENNRVYLMKLGNASPSTLIPRLFKLAEQNGYTKIFAKVPRSQSAPFLNSDYRIEATIPLFYDGKEDALFLCQYLSDQRKKIANDESLDNVMIEAREKQNAGLSRPFRADAELRVCAREDVEEMGRIYQTVFPTYPFPIHDPSYLLDTMNSHVVYFGIEMEGSLVALSSAEMDQDNAAVEMTDFATLPDWIGNSFAQHLLIAMESEMIKRQIKTAYTIARAESVGMNVTFARLGYVFGGRLANNTQISGCIESMNVWYKSLM